VGRSRETVALEVGVEVLEAALLRACSGPYRNPGYAPEAVITRS